MIKIAPQLRLTSDSFGGGGGGGGGGILNRARDFQEGNPRKPRGGGFPHLLVCKPRTFSMVKSKLFR